jgi:hypothetical protein
VPTECGQLVTTDQCHVRQGQRVRNRHPTDPAGGYARWVLAVKTQACLASDSERREPEALQTLDIPRLRRSPIRRSKES